MDRRQTISGRAIALLAVLGIAMAGCSVVPASLKPGASPPSASTPSKAAKRQAAQADLLLDPGCPLGSEAMLGLNLSEKGCRSAARTNPPGPVGTPNLP